MTTTTEYRRQFEELVQRAEQEIAQHPEAYKRRLKWLAMLGYGVIFGLLTLLLAVTGGTIWAAVTSSAIMLLLLKKKLIVILLALVWTLARSLMVRIEAPSGYELDREQYPQVWAEVDALRKELATPPIHQIVLTPEMNAAIAQTPRFGIIGPYKNTLVIGLELLMALSTEQARSVLAHELAHLSGNHSKFAGWIYRLRLTWARINEAFHDNEAWGAGLIRRFLSWYSPYFAGYSYVLARDNEFEADALAGKLTSPEHAASALVAVHVYGDLIDEHFWKPCYDKAYTHPKPEADVYAQLQQFFRQPEAYRNEFNLYLQQALTRQANSADTHPSLMQRLKALKATGMSSNQDEPAALQWLGNKAAYVVRHFDLQWIKQNNERWEAFHQSAQVARKELKEFTARNYASLSAEEQWQMAALTERYQPKHDPLPLYQRYHSAYPQDLDGTFAVGRLLLERDEEDGMNYIRKALAEPGLRYPAAEAAWRYFTRKKQQDKAELWLHELERANDMMREANEERSAISNKDTFFAPDGLETAGSVLAQELLGSLPQHSKVKEVWVAQKAVSHFPKRPVYVLAVKTGGITLNAEDLQTELVSSLQTSHDVFLITTGVNKRLAKTVMAAGRQIY